MKYRQKAELFFDKTKGIPFSINKLDSAEYNLLLTARMRFIHLLIFQYFKGGDGSGSIHGMGIVSAGDQHPFRGSGASNNSMISFLPPITPNG